MAATNYQLTTPQRLTLNPGVNGQGLNDLSPRASAKSHRKSKPSTQTSNPELVGQQLYQSLVQKSSSRVGIKTAKTSSNRTAAVINDAQQQNLQSLNLQLKDSGGIKVSFDSRKGTPTFIKPNNTSIKPKITSLAGGVTTVKPSKAAIAMQFLKDNRALLKLQNPESELQQISQTTDAQNKTHIRFQQMVNGIPLWGKQAVVHVDNDNGVYLFQGRYEPTISNINVVPNITEQAAVEKVLADLNFSSDLSEPAQTELVVYTSIGGAAVLTYKVELSPKLQDRWIYFINAASGAVVHKIFNIHKEVVQASGLGVDNVSHTFNAWHSPQDGSYYLIDPDTPTLGGNADPVADGPRPSGDTYILSAQNGDGSQLFFNTHNAQTGWQDEVAVSAAYNTRVVYDYYGNTFNRNSIDGNGKNLMVVVHFENNLDNAFWNGTFMVYGDGGGVFSPLAGCLDVAGHEMTHGVIETTAGLIYENQSGALNESFADVFGTMIDRDDWLLGENCTLVNPFHLRSMADPANGLGGGQPTHMNEYQNLPNTPDGDNGGVHINSGIPNRAAYLIADGLSIEGIGTSIGRGQTEQIYYLALTNYLTQSSQFIDARRALIQAAEDLHGANSTQALSVSAAFDAVGITEGGAATPPTPPPTPTDPVTGEDIMVYLYPFDSGHEVPPPNDPLERFDLYTQTIGGSVVGPYNDPLHGDLPANYTRPAAVTTQSGTYFLYVATDNNVYKAVFGDTDIQLSSSGDIFSIAISPNERYIVYTTNDPNDNNIYVADFENNGATSIYPILSEDYQNGSTSVQNTILYADSLAFDYTSNLIVFDALN
ncbi:MAG: M4 family metallopeptidase, partial [Gammaproteobacteria bacterium]|nr:M4 family metallopeptidase [Gammaproteobacteria bacterium]